jgi:hypothetical protein
VGDHLLVAPAVPVEIEQLGLTNIPGRWGRADAFARGRIVLEGEAEPRRAGAGRAVQPEAMH